VADKTFSRHDLEQMLSSGLSQREVSKRTGIPRSTLQRLLKAPLVLEVIAGRQPESTHGGPPLLAPVPQALLDAEPMLLEIVAWWEDRKARALTPVGGRGETRRYTFHADVGLIELVQREADAERVSYSEVVNRALRSYFTGRQG
jgi:hypothetical protein